MVDTASYIHIMRVVLVDRSPRKRAPILLRRNREELAIGSVFIVMEDYFTQM